MNHSQDNNKKNKLRPSDSDSRNLPSPSSTLGISRDARMLTREEFQGLADVPPEVEWFANIDNEHTRRAYTSDVKDFMRLVGIDQSEEFRMVSRAHVIAWRKSLEARSLSSMSIRRKLSSLSSLFDYLCEANSISMNPVHGVKRPTEGANEGKTPALSDDQARRLLDAPPTDTLKGLRDRAILSAFLYHGLRRAELAALKVRDISDRRGVPHLKVHGKGGKIRYVPAHSAALERIQDYLQKAGHGTEMGSPLFLPIRKDPTRNSEQALSCSGIYRDVVMKWAKKCGLSKVQGFSPHSLRATAATNALEHEADIARVQEWLGHSNISTTRLYDKRTNKIEESPTWRVSY